MIETANNFQGLLVAALIFMAHCASVAQPVFTHHLVSDALPVSSKGTGDYGLTALVDVNRDGKMDFILGGRGVPPSRLYWFEYHDADHWTQHLIGTNYLSDVGLAALDVDHDGWVDFVCSGVWFRNTGEPSKPFQRIIFAEKAGGAHDIVIADMNGDRRPDVVIMGDSRTELNSISWFEIPANPTNLWTRHLVGPPVHGAITPDGVGDVDGDGDLDIVRADTWFENRDGKGIEWVPHANIPKGRKGPYGICARAAFADIDGDGKKEIIMVDADIADCKAVVLWNRDGKGGAWEKTPLPQSFKYGSLHALAVADFNGDGRLDIVSNEQEELLPDGRENPRWILWENNGGGKFTERIILDDRLGGHELQVGDVDGDGDIDICSKAWSAAPWNAVGGKMHVDFLENVFPRKTNHSTLEITLDVGDQPRQSLQGFGCSLAHLERARIPEADRARMFERVFRDLQMNVLRLWIGIGAGATSASMKTQFYATYVDSGVIAEARKRGVNTLLLAPASRHIRPPEPLPDYARKLAEFISDVRAERGIRIDVTGINNEPGGFKPEELADLARLLRVELDARGLQDVGIIAPESASADATALRNIAALKTNTTAWAALRGIATHSYNMAATPAFAEAIAGANKEYWMTEASDNGNEGAADVNRASTIAARFLNDLNHGVTHWIYFIGFDASSDVLTDKDNATTLMVFDRKDEKIFTHLKYDWFRQLRAAFPNGSKAYPLQALPGGELTYTYGQKPYLNAAAARRPDGGWSLAAVNLTGV